MHGVDSSVPSPPPILVDEAGMVVADVPCKGCSYNLRGLRADSKCPECASAIELSLRGDLLRFSDPDWLDKVGMGTLLSLGGLLILIFVSLRLPLMYFMRLVPATMGLGASALAFAGTLLLTVPDPGAREERRMALARTIARVGLVIALARNIVLFFFESMPPAISALVGFVFLIAAIARTAAEVARLYYIRHLALRIPDEKLAGRAKFLSRTFAVSLGTYAIVSSIISFITLTLKQRPAWFSPAFMLLRQVSQVAWLGMIIFSIVYVFMLIRFGNAIRLQKILAQVLRRGHDTSSADLSESERGGGTSGS